MNYDLFSSSSDCSDAVSHIDMPDGDVRLYAALFSPSEATQLLELLQRDIQWQQETIRLYGQVHKQPRLTALYGDPGITYRYSGITIESTPWIPALLHIKTRTEQVSKARFNSVLLNRYRDGQDSMGWHADDEPELGRNPVIGSVSLGQSRTLQMKHRIDKSKRLDIPLANGSFLLMQGEVQHYWLHQIAKSRRHLDERINLTYRLIS